MSQKKIIKLTSSQTQLMTLKNLKIHLNKPVIYSRILKENTSLPLQQKACGLFNPINNNANIDADGNGKTNDFIEINDKQNDEKYNKKINEVDLIDDFDSAAQNLDFFNDELENNLNFENENLIDFFPSNHSMQFEECLEQISPLAINSTNNSNIQTEHDNSNVMTLDLSLQVQQQQDQEINANDPFLNDFLLSQEHVLNQDKSIDHEHLYASKRQLEEDQDVEEKQKKKQRVKGIYRAKDVKTEQDFENYVERRLKNNKSSKISRSNKKNHYNQMEQKSDQLEQENQILKEKIEKLQTNISTIKSFLISNLNQC